jgi:hypothetical protein
MAGPLVKKNLTTVLFYDDEYAYVKRTSEARRVSMAQVVREAVRAFMSADSANHPMPIPSSEHDEERVA